MPWLFLPNWLHAVVVRLSALRVLLFVLAIASCAAWQRELRSGWVKTEFVDGQYHDEVVCRLSKDKDGDVVGKCVPLENYLDELLWKLNELGLLKAPKKAHTGEL